jgi:hypothetical protein
MRTPASLRTTILERPWNLELSGCDPLFLACTCLAIVPSFLPLREMGVKLRESPALPTCCSLSFLLFLVVLFACEV